MKFAIICGYRKEDLDHFATLSNIHLCLCKWVRKGNYYTRFYKNLSRQGHYVILDNNVYEDGKAASVDEILTKAKLVGAHEVIAPDVLHNREANYKSITSFLSTLSSKEKGTYKVMGVVQAKQNNPSDWVKAYKDLCKTPIDVVGLSCLGVPYSFARFCRTDCVAATRRAAISLLLKYEFFDYEKEHHCLGLGRLASELSWLDKTGIIRSCDSASPYYLGKMNIRYGVNRLPRQKPHDHDFDTPLTDEQRRNVYYNISHLGNYLKTNSIFAWYAAEQKHRSDGD